MAIAHLVSNNSIKIEKGIPIPGNRSSTSYPLEQMQVGDSFAVPGTKYGSLRQTAYARAGKLGMKFKVSKRGDEARCWRIA